MGRKRTENGVREVFEIAGDEKSSNCLICEKSVSGSHLGNLTKHLKRHHNDVYDKINSSEQISMEPPRKKKKITVEYDIQELLDAWLALVVVEGRPFTILDSKALRTIAKPLFDALELEMLSSSTVGDEIQKKAEARRNQIRQLLSGKMISLKIDAASRHRRRLVCINAQIIINGKIVVKTLSMSEMNCSHSGKNIKEYVLSILQRYDINIEQVYSITQDNGRNFICAANMMEYLDLNVNWEDEGEVEGIEEDESIDDEPEIHENESGDYEGEEEEDEEDFINLVELKLFGVQVIRCAAHTLNLAVLDTLDQSNLKKIISKFRKLAKHLRTPTNTDKLKAEKLTKPKIDTKTRWNSAYDMVISLMRLKNFCETEKITILTDSDWAQGEIFLEIFKPTKIASKRLQNMQLSLGDFFKLWLDLTLRVQKLSNCSQNKTFAAKLYTNLITREVSLFKDNPTLLAALYLDPRFRRILEKIKPNYFNITTAQEHLLSLHKQIKKIENEQRKKTTSSTAPMTSTTSSTIPTAPFASSVPSTSPTITSRSEISNSEHDDILKNYINELYEDQSESSEQEQVDQDEDIVTAFSVICNYDDKQPLDTNLLEYWHSKRFSNPILYKLASVLHAVPATQVTVERCFSVLRFILSDYRTRMLPDILEDLMILRLNLDASTI